MTVGKAVFGVAIVLSAQPIVGLTQLGRSEPSVYDARDLIVEARYDAAEAILGDALRSSEFPARESEYRATVYFWSAVLALAQSRDDRAREMVRAFASEPSADYYEFAELVTYAQRDGPADLAAETLQYFVEDWPEALTVVDPEVIARILGAFDDESLASPRWVELTAALDGMDASSMDPGFLSRIWRNVALSAVERNEEQLAIQAIDRISSVLTLVTIQVDKRFAALAEGHPELFDIDDAMQREVALLMRQATANPRRLAPRVRLARSLRRANRPGEALAITNLTIDRLLLPTGDRNNWDDVASATGALLEEKAQLLWLLGRHEESIEQLRQARLMPQSNGPNIDQTFSLAQACAQMGMTEEARMLAAELGALSSEVAEVVGIVELIIGAQQGDASLVSAALNDLVAAREKSRAFDVLSLLVAGALDDAALSYIEWLDDPESRFEALLFVQEFIADPAGGTLAPVDRILVENMRELRERPDVAAAVATVGRIDSFAIRYVYPLR